MKRGVLILIGLMIIVIAGGVLTANVGVELPTVIQSEEPAPSAFRATPEQANLMLFWSLFVLGNLVVIGGVTALLFWLFHRWVKNANATPNRAEQTASDAESLPESSG